MLAVSPTFPDKYEGTGHHLLKQPVCIHVYREHLTKNILSLMTKTQAKQLSFDYVENNAEDGLPNLAYPTQGNFVPPIIPPP
jgi:hypothetical protein